MIPRLVIFTSFTCCFLLIEMSSAMFFTNSKENDYPRIGKRPGALLRPSVSLLSKKRKTWERDSRFDVPELTHRMAQDIDDLLNFHGSEELIVRRKDPQPHTDLEDLMADFWTSYRDSERFHNRNFDKKK